MSCPRALSRFAPPRARFSSTQPLSRKGAGGVRTRSPPGRSPRQDGAVAMPGQATKRGRATSARGGPGQPSATCDRSRARRRGGCVAQNARPAARRRREARRRCDSPRVLNTARSSPPPSPPPPPQERNSEQSKIMDELSSMITTDKARRRPRTSCNTAGRRAAAEQAPTSPRANTREFLPRSRARRRWRRRTRSTASSSSPARWSRGARRAASATSRAPSRRPSPSAATASWRANAQRSSPLHPPSLPLSSKREARRPSARETQHGAHSLSCRRRCCRSPQVVAPRYYNEVSAPLYAGAFDTNVRIKARRSPRPSAQPTAQCQRTRQNLSP